MLNFIKWSVFIVLHSLVDNKKKETATWKQIITWSKAYSFGYIFDVSDIPICASLYDVLNRERGCSTFQNS